MVVESPSLNFFYVILVCFAFQISRECIPLGFSYGNEKRMCPGAWLVEFPLMLLESYYYLHVMYLE
jgi:hypothetical protein